MRISVSCRPAFDYGRQTHDIQIEANGATFKSGSVSLALSTNVPLRDDGHGGVSAEVRRSSAWLQKKTHAYAANRSQDTFYNANGTIAISVTGSASKEGENTDGYSVVYARFQPSLTEKTIISLNRQKVVCQ